MSGILILEPDKLLAKTYLDALEKQGHNVYWVRTAQMAIVMLDQYEIDVMVLELQLIKHNGIEFLYEMRSYVDWQSLPVIIQSFTSPKIMQNHILNQHIRIEKFLYKPSSKLQDLVQAVTDICQTKVPVAES